MKLEEAKILYQGERITFRTSEESDNPEGEVALHNKDRRTFSFFRSSALESSNALTSPLPLRIPLIFLK